MSEYWVSQPKKQCEYCKCWITDNKPSRDFHERGKKHQEMVKQKLDKLRKKGATDAKKAKEMEGSLKKMEKAAMAALKKDLAKDPSLAAQYGVVIKPKQLPVEGPEMRPTDYKDPDPRVKKDPPLSDMKNLSTATKVTASECKQETGEWYEAKSDQGYTYYWNTVNGESVWETPENYVSLDEQKTGKLQESSGSDKPSDTNKPADSDKPSDVHQPVTSGIEEDIPDIPETVTKSENESSVPLENPALGISDISNIPLPGSIPLPPDPSQTTKISDLPGHVPGSEVKKSDSSEEENEDSGDDKPIERTARTYTTKRPTDAYGGWETVTKLEKEQIDLQLPKTSDPTPEESTGIIITAESTRIKFREKKVDTLGKEFIAFKKRKLAQGAKNLRQKDNN